MRKRILFCATVDYHFQAFHLPYLKWFKEQGWEVHIAANGSRDLPYADKKFNIPIQRTPLHSSNFKALWQLKKIIKNNQYTIIHCHTPMGGVLTRLAAIKSRESGTNVFYTAHGFHFSKGSSLFSWTTYYPIERFLSKLTDQLITINNEDYHLALTRGFRAKNIDHVFGVGVDSERYKPILKNNKGLRKQKLGFYQDDFLIIYTAEFNKNKNQKFLIHVIDEIKHKVPNIKLLLAGDGALIDSCKALVLKLGLERSVQFLGYRSDIDQLLPVCDLAVSSSVREGLPVNILEAMSCGLPIIATKNRGHVELVFNDMNGWIIDNNSLEDMSAKIVKIYFDSQLREMFGKKSREIILQKYSISQTLEQNMILYKRCMEETGDVEWIVR